MGYVVWFIAGCVIAVPYTFLANGSLENFFMTAWIAPACALALFSVRMMPTKIFGSKRRYRMVFWALVFYFCLPVLLNGASLLLKVLDHETAGHAVFQARYISILIPIAIWFMAGLIIEIASIISNAIGRASKRLGFKSNPAPPDSGDLD